MKLVRVYWPKKSRLQNKYMTTVNLNYLILKYLVLHAFLVIFEDVDFFGSRTL